MATNPLVQQGTLNRVRGQVVVPNFTNLNITAPYMGKSMLRLALEGNFTDQIPTATGVVNSPEPYVMATCTVGLLRTQALSGQWLAQAINYSVIGPIQVYSDSSAFPLANLDNCSIYQLDPGAFDGQDPVVRLILRGTFYLNNNLWNLT